MWVAVAAALIGLGTVLLRANLERRQRRWFGPPVRATERAVAVERDTFKESFRYTRLFIGDEVEFEVEIPAGGSVRIDARPSPNFEGRTTDLEVFFNVDPHGWEPTRLVQTTRIASEDGWSDLGRFVNDGEGGSFRISVGCVRAPFENSRGPLAWFGSMLPPAAIRFWAPPEKAEALWIRQPCVVGPEDGESPSLFLISIDTLRADHLGFNGYGRNTSPNLDRLAGDSVVFKRAYSSDTWTLPSHVSMLTSRYTSAHHVNEPGKAVESVGFDMLQQRLAESSYRTAALTDGGLMSARYGFDEGFDLFREDVGVLGNEGFRGMAARTFDRVEAWLDDHRGGPFFLFVHSHEVHHFPNAVPEHVEAYSQAGYDGLFAGNEDSTGNFVDRIHQAESDDDLVEGRDVRYAVDLYDGAIRSFDRELGRFLRRLKARGLYDRSLIVVTADHGESFRDFHDNGRTRLWYHFRPPYVEQIAVPLIIKFPVSMGLQGVIDREVSLLDVAPTMLEVAGVSQPSSFQGRSLVPTLTGSAREAPGPVIAERVPPSRKEKGLIWVTAIKERKTVVRRMAHDGSDARVECYDLARDPGERRNLADTPSADLDPWAGLIEAAAIHSEGVLAARRQAVERSRPDLESEHLDRLRKLGYIESGETPVDDQ